MILCERKGNRPGGTVLLSFCGVGGALRGGTFPDFFIHTATHENWGMSPVPIFFVLNAWDGMGLHLSLSYFDVVKVPDVRVPRGGVFDAGELCASRVGIFCSDSSGLQGW